MKKRIAYIFIFISLLCAVLSVFSAAQSLDGSFTITYQPTFSFAVPGGASITVYDAIVLNTGRSFDRAVLEYCADGSTLYVPIGAAVGHVDYLSVPSRLTGKVRVKIFNDDILIATSNDVTFNDRFMISLDFDTERLQWPVLPNVTSYTVQKFNPANNTWSDIWTAPGKFDGVFNEIFFGEILRVKATYVGGWYSYSVEYHTPTRLEFEQKILPSYNIGTDPLLPTYTERSIDNAAVKRSTNLLFSGAINTKLFPFVSAAVGLLVSFAVVSYFAFRMH